MGATHFRKKRHDPHDRSKSHKEFEIARQTLPRWRNIPPGARRCVVKKKSGCEKKSCAWQLHITPRGVELLDPKIRRLPITVLFWRSAMKKLLILTTLAALSSVSFGCCGMGGCGGMGGCFGRRDECAPAYEPAGCAPCDACNAGAVGAPVMGAPVITTPGTTTVVPGPAYTGFLPRK
jgi:hypothetical protein